MYRALIEQPCIEGREAVAVADIVVDIVVWRVVGGEWVGVGWEWV